MMAERGLSIDHVTIWRWVQRYAPVLNQRIRRELRRPNRSWRVDETYVKVAGNWAYLYRAIDSTGETIDFMLSPKRDLTAAKLFLRLALSGGGPSPRVINVDGHPAYASAITELKESGELGSLSLSNIALPEQHHRAGPPVNQKADHGKPRIPIGRRRVENHRGLRGDACNPEGTNPLAG
jgi:transposase-like protein